MFIRIKKISNYFNKRSKINNINNDMQTNNNFKIINRMNEINISNITNKINKINKINKTNYSKNNNSENSSYKTSNSENSNSENSSYKTSNSENSNSENSSYKTSNSENTNSNDSNSNDSKTNDSNSNDSKTNNKKPEHTIINEDDYIKYKNICPKIAELFNLKYDNDKFNKYNINIPHEYGLSNSEKIIPEYYLSNSASGKIIEIDFTNTIIDSIKNIRRLTYYQKEHLKSLKKNELYEIIIEYDNTINELANIINNIVN